MSDYEFITYQVERGRARITLNRPERRNALSGALLTELAAALWDADDDKRVHSVILRGAGTAFCAGYDITPGINAPATDIPRRGGGIYEDTTIDDDIWRLERGQRLRMVLFDMHKPVVAQVHGYCIAGGTDIALLSDMVITADDAIFGFPPARDLGALPNQMWLYHCGPQWAKRLLLTGDSLTGKDAAEIGLALKSYPAAELETEVMRLADRMGLVDPHLLSANKRLVNLGLELMGARTIQRIGAEIDARGHLAPKAVAFKATMREHGVKHAFQKRDALFGNQYAAVRGRDPD